MSSVSEPSKDSFAIGWEGEKMAYEMLRKNGLLNSQQFDRILRVRNHWVCIEVKHKANFTKRGVEYNYGPDWEGTGLNRAQFEARLQFEKETQIPCFLLIFPLDTNTVYGQWLHTLQALPSEHKFLTKYNIIVFPLSKFVEGEKEIVEALKAVKAPATV